MHNASFGSKAGSREIKDKAETQDVEKKEDDINKEKVKKPKSANMVIINKC